MDSVNNLVNFFTPAPGYILLEPIEKDESLTLSHASPDKEPLKKGVVLAVGEDLITQYGATICSPVAVGEVAVHTTVGFEEIKHDYKLYRVIPFGNILGTYEK